MVQAVYLLAELLAGGHVICRHAADSRLPPCVASGSGIADASEPQPSQPQILQYQPGKHSIAAQSPMCCHDHVHPSMHTVQCASRCGDGSGGAYMAPSSVIVPVSFVTKSGQNGIKGC